MNYLRQEGIFDQGILNRSHITIIGASEIGNNLALYLCGLGIGGLTIIDKENVVQANCIFSPNDRGKNKAMALCEKVNQINADIETEAISIGFEKSMIKNKDTIVNATNKIIDFSGISQPMFIASASNYCASFTTDQKNLPEFMGQTQGPLPSSMISAILLDEIRKSIMPLEGDIKFKGRFNYHLDSKFSHNREIKFLNGISADFSNDNALIVGAGGIGTYVYMNLLGFNFKNIHIFDGDSIEDHNLNRQVMFYKAIGKNKAETLVRRLSHLAPKTESRFANLFIDESFLDRHLSKYNFIFGCVDSWKTRKMLSDYAVRYSIPFIDGTVSAFGAGAYVYVPEKTACLDCQLDYTHLIKESKNAIGTCLLAANSNVVMNNALIGSYMASLARDIKLNRELVYSNKFRYNSKKGRIDLVKSPGPCDCGSKK